MNKFARPIVIPALLIWAVSATLLLFFRPDISIALNNRIFQRETQQGHLFLLQDSGPEGFVAFGNETSIFCARPCVVEEIGAGSEQGSPMCNSLPADRKYVCSARYWPGRQYIVQSQRSERASQPRSTQP